MNRIPKYRVWHRIEKRFVDLRNIDFASEKIGYDRDREFNYWEVEPFDNIVFQQYTGYNDFKGKEIYEGDIFKSDNNRKWDPVEFKNGQWQANLRGARVFSLYEMFGDDIGTGGYPEVIGNIFENE